MSDPVAAAMREAARRFVLPRFRRPELQGLHAKEGGDPVTLADLEAEAFLRDELPRIVDVPVVGEEGWSASAREQLRRGDAWIVDPLDGTKPFVAGDDRFAMIVARIEGGELVGGWLLFPARNELFSAVSGAGTLHDGHPVRVARDDAPGRLRLTWLEADDRARVEPGLRSAGWTDDTPTCWELRRLLVGEPGGYLCSHVTPWDMAAGLLLVREAGGAVSRSDGSEARATDESGLYVFGPDATTIARWRADFRLDSVRCRSPIAGAA